MYLSVGAVSKMTGVSPSSIRRWEREDILVPDYRTPGNHRRYSYKKVLKFLGLQKYSGKKAVVYGRVSSNKQKNDLKRQINNLENYAEKQNIEVIRVYKDIGSGMNDNRKNLLKLISSKISTGLSSM